MPDKFENATLRGALVTDSNGNKINVIIDVKLKICHIQQVAQV